MFSAPTSGGGGQIKNKVWLHVVELSELHALINCVDIERKHMIYTAKIKKNSRTNLR
jgi:hypothetical protein